VKVQPLERVKPRKAAKKPATVLAQPEALVQTTELPSPVDDDALETILGRMAQLKAVAKSFSEANGAEFRALQAQAIELLRQRFGVTPEMATADNPATFEGEKVAGTLVQVQNPVLDEDAIRRGLPKDVWMKVSRRVIDHSLLASAIEMELVPKSLVEANTTYKANAPYVLATPKVTT
jgi:hypothetical protein